jgi:hypothetical protein
MTNGPRNVSTGDGDELPKTLEAIIGRMGWPLTVTRASRLSAGFGGKMDSICRLTAVSMRLMVCVVSRRLRSSCPRRGAARRPRGVAHARRSPGHESGCEA